jgi:hypothetical protein
MQKTKTFITLETRQKTVIHYRRRIASGWCGRCGANVLALLPEEAADLRGTSRQKVFDEIEEGSLHFSRSTPQGMLVCCGPISTKEENEKGRNDNEYKKQNA